MGFKVSWRQNLERDYIVVDQREAYSCDRAGILRKIPVDENIKRLPSKSGYFDQVSGKVSLIQELRAKPYEVDLFVRLSMSEETNGRIKSSESISRSTLPV
ncbi:MAG: hypothetical protein M1368_11330, partial [Thaumarchaeota archaeon]|nr:hypothetical protein [Nitrososphaerota archaeon]